MNITIRMDVKSIWSGIVLYHPNKERLLNNIENLSNQVEKIICFNNGCANDFLQELETKYNVIIIGDGNNIGLARALNLIMVYAHKMGATWVITMDQDSVLPDNYIKTVCSKNIDSKVAIICPRVVDKRRLQVDSDCNIDEQYVDRCITSASCTRIAAWEQIGGFDNRLFIDLVDNDFCKRLKILDWKILKINSIVLDQEFSEIEPKGTRTTKFIKFICKLIPNKKLANNIAKLAYKKKVSPLRVYYTNRNIIYLNKKFKHYGGIGYDCYSCRTYIGYFLSYGLMNIIRSDKKIEMIKTIFKGVRDGKKLAKNIQPLNYGEKNKLC